MAEPLNEAGETWDDPDRSFIYTPADLDTAKAEARNEALEEAAQCAEVLGPRFYSKEMREAADAIALEIRNKKHTPMDK